MQVKWNIKIKMTNEKPKSLDWLAEKEYLGRGFLIGQTPQYQSVAVYFVTGRQPSSRARKFELDGDAIKTTPTDPEVLKTGNPALLLYDAIRRVRTRGDQLVVSNGAQTDLIANHIPSCSPSMGYYSYVEFLANAFNGPHFVQGVDVTAFEPDPPNNTPRISGIMGHHSGAIAICKYNGTVESDFQFFEFPLRPGEGRFISTYTGQNVPKGVAIPSFEGEPVRMQMPGKTPEEIAENFYRALGPKKKGPGIISPNEDFRVGVVVAIKPSKGEDLMESYIINRCGLK